MAHGMAQCTDDQEPSVIPLSYSGDSWLSYYFNFWKKNYKYFSFLTQK